MTTPPRDDQAHDSMAAPADYTVFGFPLANLPGPGQAITYIDLHDTLWPLIEGTRVLLSALGTALKTEDITSQEGCEAIELLDGNLETAMYILTRFDDTEESRRGDTGTRRRASHRRGNAEGDDAE